MPAIRRWSAIAALLLPGLLHAGESADPVPVPAPAPPTAPKPPPPPKQSAVPPAADLERVGKELRALYKAEYASRKAEERAALARRLLAQGREAGDEASRYVLLQESCELSAKAGAVEQLLEALEVWIATFRIDADAERLRLIGSAAQGAVPGQVAAAATALSGMADEAVLRDDYAQAQKYMVQAEQAARRVRDPVLIAQMRAQADQLKIWAEAWSQIGEIEDPLGGITATSHARLGRFHALLKGDWSRALPHLAQGDENALRAAAVAEQAAKTPEAQAVAADTWYELAGKERAGARTQVLVHCVTLYRQALNGLAGLDRARVDKRLGELERILGGARGNARLVPGCVVYLSFERDSLAVDGGRPVALDSSGHGVHGRVSGAIKPTGGTFGVAMEFAGGSIDLGASRDLAIAGSMSISMWLKPAVISQRRNPFSKCFGGEGAITIEDAGGLTYFWGANGADVEPYQGFGSGEAVVQGAWSHLVLVRDLGPARQLIWYFNGRRSHVGTASYPTSKASPLPVLLGLGYTAVPYLGLFDEFAMWPRALSDVEVTTLHAGTAAGR